MKALSFFILFFALTALGREPPHIGYIYPAGGKSGTTIRVEIGGQRLKNATRLIFSDKRISGEVLRYTVKYDPKTMRRFLRNRKNLQAELKEAKGEKLEAARKRLEKVEQALSLADLPKEVDPFDEKALRKYYQSKSRDQFNPQISERIEVKIAIGKEVPLGEYSIRVQGDSGLSNPLVFQVGTFDEIREEEPNDDHMAPSLQRITLPAVINGQILPGDIDHFRFHAKKGDSLVVEVAARKIIPYLADAVPGWFQAIAALYDENGNEVAYRDDYKFNPDPVLFFEVPHAGDYTLSIRDAIYRGREDFIYRIRIGTFPFLTSIFPLGGQAGMPIDLALYGKNLPETHLHGMLPKGAEQLRQISVHAGKYRSNALPFAMDSLPNIPEQEPNPESHPQKISLPCWINGRIHQPDDLDTFSFQGKKGQTIAIEVAARRLYSPLDSFISLSGPSLSEPIRNDDWVDHGQNHLFLGEGLITHHADSYLLQTLPATGTYTVQIGDTQGHGGNDYAYRLRIAPAHPDFTLYLSPSGVQIAPGATALFTLRVLRTDGFKGEIHLYARNLPDGFKISEASIPPGSSRTRFTLTAPPKKIPPFISPEIFGTATIDNHSITNRAIPTDNEMQAFLYRHLVPAQELLLSSSSRPSALFFEAVLPPSGVIHLPLGKEIAVHIRGRHLPGSARITLELDHPPEGIEVVKSWIGRKKKGVGPNGKPRFDKRALIGQIRIKATKPLQPGWQTSLFPVVVVKRGKQETRIPGPAIPVEIISP